MNEAAHGRAGDKTEQPEDKQNDTDSPQHKIFLSVLSFAASWCAAAPTNSVSPMSLDSSEQHFHSTVACEFRIAKRALFDAVFRHSSSNQRFADSVHTTIAQVLVS